MNGQKKHNKFVLNVMNDDFHSTEDLEKQFKSKIGIHQQKIS